MTANEALISFLVLFWALLWLGTKVERLCRGRRFRGGTSFIPVVPFLPIIAFVVGWFVNLGIPPWGTVCVAAIHVVLVAIASVGIWLNPAK
ncbi:MAG: hypothetical protein WD875_07910 [Pirellulales bacterium]